MSSARVRLSGCRVKHLAAAMLMGACLWLSATPHAHAWGAIGHRVIGQVADSQLTPRAASKVSKIMNNGSLGSVANWMDDVRSTPDGMRMRPWHYQSISACDKAETACDHEQCAGPQIEKAIGTLKSGKGNQLKALRVLVHLVGDIHQPLHAAENGGDRGGNLVFLANRYCIDYKTQRPVNCNLHTYWDNMLVKAVKGDGPEKDLVFSLAAASVSTAGDVRSWLDGSNELARSTAHHYEGFACKKGHNTVSVNDDYDRDAAEAVRAQLAAAGHRLARILNDIYQQPAP